MNLLVEREDREGICWLTLNRPASLNALNLEMFTVLRRHIDALEGARESIRCVVLQGAGRSFCAGADLKALRNASPDDPLSTFEPDTIDAFAALPQPTLAVIQGHCFTGGLELALAADLLIADEGARFADTHARWGLCPAWGMTRRLPRRIGPGRAKELMFTTREIDAAEALAIGLVDRVVPADSLAAEALALATAIAANAPRAIQWTKRTLEACLGSPGDAVALERTGHPGLGNEFEGRVRGKW